MSCKATAALPLRGTFSTDWQWLSARPVTMWQGPLCVPRQVPLARDPRFLELLKEPCIGVARCPLVHQRPKGSAVCPL